MLSGKKIGVTGGAGFIGSNLIDALLKAGNQVVCLDNFSTGKRENIAPFLNHPSFKLIEGDIRNLEDCKKVVAGADIVFHEAALGSVPRSIVDPITTNDVNIGGFVNMLVAVRDAGVKRMVYAASSSTYGDSEKLPKVEDEIGRPLSPYAVTKYVNELYADVFAKTYSMELIGLRYFNVFGPHQDPDGAYAAVIPKFIKLLKNHQQPLINGDGTYSRDFTYVANVVQANLRAASIANPEALNTVYNVACGERINLNELVAFIKEEMAQFDKSILEIDPIYQENRKGDIPHSLASISKAIMLLKYSPTHNVKKDYMRQLFGIGKIYSIFKPSNLE